MKTLVLSFPHKRINSNTIWRLSIMNWEDTHKIRKKNITFLKKSLTSNEKIEWREEKVEKSGSGYKGWSFEVGIHSWSVVYTLTFKPTIAIMFTLIFNWLTRSWVAFPPLVLPCKFHIVTLLQNPWIWVCFRRRDSICPRFVNLGSKMS